MVPPVIGRLIHVGLLLAVCLLPQHAAAASLMRATSVPIEPIQPLLEASPVPIAVIDRPPELVVRALPRASRAAGALEAAFARLVRAAALAVAPDWARDGIAAIPDVDLAGEDVIAGTAAAFAFDLVDAAGQRRRAACVVLPLGTGGQTSDSLAANTWAVRLSGLSLSGVESRLGRPSFAALQVAAVAHEIGHCLDTENRMPRRSRPVQPAAREDSPWFFAWRLHERQPAGLEETAEALVSSYRREATADAFMALWLDRQGWRPLAAWMANARATAAVARPRLDYMTAMVIDAALAAPPQADDGNLDGLMVAARAIADRHRLGDDTANALARRQAEAQGGYVSLADCRDDPAVQALVVGRYQAVMGGRGE